MEWVQRGVGKIIPDEQWLRERYLQRSAAELLAEGTTFAWAPCPERTLVAVCALGLHGVPHRVVVHERQVPGAGPPITHMAIELDTDDGPFWFDFSRQESKFCTGTYTFRADIERTIRVDRIDVPFTPEMLALRPVDLMSIVRISQADQDMKVNWFVGDLDHMDPRVLEEHIIFSPEASRYERAPARPWSGDLAGSPS
jgi:hypothetical protein